MFVKFGFAADDTYMEERGGCVFGHLFWVRDQVRYFIVMFHISVFQQPVGKYCLLFFTRRPFQLWDFYNWSKVMWPRSEGGSLYAGLFPECSMHFPLSRCSSHRADPTVSVICSQQWSARFSLVCDFFKNSVISDVQHFCHPHHPQERIFSLMKAPPFLPS